MKLLLPNNIFGNVCLALALILVLSLPFLVTGQPTGVDIMSNVTDAPLPTPASAITTAGGTFTTMVLNGTFQTPRWKAYVGNVTGRITLDDSAGSTIYDWELATITGRVYVSRNDSIEWDNVNCVSDPTLASEQAFLDIDDTFVDSINRTFNDTIHRSFFVGTQFIANSSCRAIATYVNDTRQPPSENASFQEVLLEDSVGNVIYTTMLEDAVEGYDSGLYDFQLIVPENPFAAVPTTYYFFAEIS